MPATFTIATFWSRGYKTVNGARVVEWLQQVDKRNVVGCGFILAMMAAPFIALIYGFGFGLVVLSAGLLLTAVLAFDARGQVDPSRKNRVLTMAMVALALAIVTGLAAVSRFR